MYDELVSEVNNIDTSRFVLKTQNNMDKLHLEKKNNDADKRIIRLDMLRNMIIMLRSLR